MAKARTESSRTKTKTDVAMQPAAGTELRIGTGGFVPAATMSELLSRLTDEKVRAIKNVGTQELAKAALDLIVRAASDFGLAGRSDEARHRSLKLTGGGVTELKLLEHGNVALEMIAKEEAADAAERAYRAASSTANDAKAAAEAAKGRMASAMRACFGNTSEILKDYGVPMLGGTHGGKKRSPAKGDPTPGSGH